MEDKDIDDILSSIKAPIDHPLFYPRVFALAAKQLKATRVDPSNLAASARCNCY